MKKKILAIFVAFIVFAFLASCSGGKNYTSTANLIEVPNEENLYYHAKTRVVYFIFNEYTLDNGYGYMSPYYSENGNLYRYDLSENKMVEIVK